MTRRRLPVLGSHTAHRRAAFLSLGLYLVSLGFQGLAATGSNPYGFDGYRGFHCLLFGWTTILGSLAFFVPWTANLLYLPSLLLLAIPARPLRVFLALPAMGLALALGALRIDEVLVNEAGHRSPVELGAGAWLWLASFSVLIAGFLLPRSVRDDATTCTAHS